VIRTRAVSTGLPGPAPLANGAVRIVLTLCKAAQGLDEHARDPDHNSGDQHGQTGKYQKVIQDTYHADPSHFDLAMIL
jgi:hypothetical protein